MGRLTRFVVQCLTDLCNGLAFINSNSDVFMGYTAWSAGGCSASDYNLTMTPFGSAGNFSDQMTLSMCVVGTRNGTVKETSSMGDMSGGVNTSSSITISGSTRQVKGVGFAMVAAMIALTV